MDNGGPCPSEGSQFLVFMGDLTWIESKNMYM